jgi:hypothetical protein
MIHTINHCAALEIKLTSDDENISIAEGLQQKFTGDGAMNGCIGALDGFSVRLKATLPEEWLKCVSILLDYTTTA